MKLEDMTPEERAKVDICKCGHSRAEHDLWGGSCTKCGPRKCLRFTWSHFKEEEEPNDPRT